jgi:hypothetical protein
MITETGKILVPGLLRIPKIMFPEKKTGASFSWKESKVQRYSDRLCKENDSISKNEFQRSYFTVF